MWSKFVGVLLFTMAVHLLAAQTIVDRVEIEGLHKTKPFYVHQQIEFRAGDSLCTQKIQQDLQYIKNIKGVNDAQYRVEEKGDSTILCYIIDEAISWLPSLYLGSVGSNSWLEAGLTDINFVGRGYQLNATYRYADKRHSGSLYMQLPPLGKRGWGVSFSLVKHASVEPLFFPAGEKVFYEYDVYNASASVLYRFNRFNSLQMGGAYFIEEYHKRQMQGEVLPGPDMLRQPKVLGKLVHEFDKLSYDYYYLEGWLAHNWWETVYTPSTQDWFHLLFTDIRYYHVFGEKTNLGLRFKMGVSTNRKSPFAPFALSSYLNIRGVGDRVDRGTGSLVLNAEMRQTVYDKKQWASQLVVFTDAGLWRKPGQSFFEDNNFEQSYHQYAGGGIRIIYKKAYNAIFRLDYGLDITSFSNGGAVLGIGQYF